MSHARTHRTRRPYRAVIPVDDRPAQQRLLSVLSQKDWLDDLALGSTARDGGPTVVVATASRGDLLSVQRIAQSLELGLDRVAR